MILGAASNEKQTAALRSIQVCADTTVLQNQDKPACKACGVVDKGAASWVVVLVSALFLLVFCLSGVGG